SKASAIKGDQIDDDNPAIAPFFTSPMRDCMAAGVAGWHFGQRAAEEKQTRLERITRTRARGPAPALDGTRREQFHARAREGVVKHWHCRMILPHPLTDKVGQRGLVRSLE